MKSVPLTAYPRTLARRGGVKKLRASGRVPAIIYGQKTEALNLEIRTKEIEDLVHHAISENLLVDLTIDADAKPKRLALVQEVQHHPISRRILHVDFHEVFEDEKVTVTVPVETVGEAVGVKAGGVLEHVMFRVKVRALPRNLPEFITIEVSHLEIGKAVHLGEIKPPPDVEIIGDKTLSVVAVAAPVTEEEAAAEEAAAAEAVAAGDVEMIKEKKEEGEAEVPAGKGAERGAAARAGEKAAPAKAGEKAAPGKAAEKAPAAAKAGEKVPAGPAEKKPAEKKR